MSNFMLCGRPLTYGDTEQIKALKELRRKAEKEEERQKKREAGETTMYVVTVVASGSTTVTVEAVDEDEAEKFALKEVSDIDFDLDFEVYKIEED